MVFLLGILQPASGRRWNAAEAPRKTAFFGGADEVPTGATPASPAERDARILRGGDPIDLEADRDRRYAMSCWPYPL